MLLQTLHRGQRDTRLCHYFINYTTLYPLPLPQPGGFPFHLLIYSSSPSTPAYSAVVAVSLAPDISMPAFYHQCIPTRFPCFLTIASHMSRSDRVAIYCTTIFCLLWMYIYIISNPASTISASAEEYSYFLSPHHSDSHPVSCYNTWSWNSPRTRPMQGVTTHVSAPKSNIKWTADLKKNMYTCGPPPTC